MVAKKSTRKQHEHILMPTKLNPNYLCCVRKGCHYTEYRTAAGKPRRRVLSQYEERHGVPRRVEPAMVVEPVTLWQWAESQATA